MVPASEPVTIRLYDNRRFYQPGKGRYVELDDLVRLARQGVEIVIHDARSGADITPFILSQTSIDQ